MSDLLSKKFIFAFTTDKEDIRGFGNDVDESEYTAAVQPTAWFVNAIFAARDDWEKSHLIKFTN